MSRRAFVIGGGESLNGFDFSKLRHETTIAVNKSGFYVPNLDYFITMDSSFLKKIKDQIKDLNTTKIFVANQDNDYISHLNRTRGLHYQDIHFDDYPLQDFDMIIKSYKSEGIGFEWNNFRNGINSGFCALQLAILLNYNVIYLLGIDLLAFEKTHFHSGYNEPMESFQKKLSIYYKNFQRAIKKLKEKRPDIKIYSCSEISRLNNLLKYKKI